MTPCVWSTMTQDWARAVNLLRSRRGIAAVEFALIAPFIVWLLIFTVDCTLYLFTTLQLSNAVAAGAEYALVNGQAVSPNSAGCSTTTPPCLTVATLRANIKTIVQNATSPALAAPTVYYNTSSATAGDSDTIFYSCYCPNSAAAAAAQTASTCSTACADGTQPGSYVAIQASTTFTPIFPGDQWLAAGTISNTAWVRVQ